MSDAPERTLHGYSSEELRHMDSEEFMSLFFSIPVTPPTSEQLAAAKARSDEYEAWRDEYHRTPEGRAYLIQRAADDLADYKATGVARFLETHRRLMARLQELDQ